VCSRHIGFVGKQCRFSIAAFGPAFIAASTTTSISAAAAFPTRLPFILSRFSHGSQVIGHSNNFHYCRTRFRGLGARGPIFTTPLSAPAPI
jgi:hypothetical protein